MIDNGCISYDPKFGTFTVIGSTGKAHVVQMFPSESCSCPAKSHCYHLLAVKRSLGIKTSNNSLKAVNLTRLRRNTRSKSERKSGRKRPKPGIIIVAH